MNEQQENPFRPPSEVESSKQVSSLAYLLACLIWCGLAIKVIVVQPIVRSMFEEFGVALPALTIALIHPLTTGIFIACAVGMLVAGVITNTPTARRRVGRFGLLAAVIAFGLIAIGFGLPLISLMQALSGP